MKKIYLACPYSHEIEDIRISRFHLANRKAAHLMEKGYIVFSPLSHSHPISNYTKTDSMDHDFWLKQDLTWLAMCDELWIYCLPDWEKSRGIKEEVLFAEKNHIPVYYIF